MEQQRTEQTEANAQGILSAGEYSRMLGTLGVGVISFLLDDELTIQGASDQFYQKTGFLEEEFCRRFQTLRQYYLEYPDDYTAVKSSLTSAANEGETSVELKVRMPQKGKGFLWAGISVAFMDSKSQENTLCHALCRDIGEEILLAEEQDHRCEKSTEYFKWMLDEYVGYAYIADMETYELLYLNQTCCDTLGLPLDKVLGHKCYEVIQNRTSPCPFCTNACITEDEFYQWEYFNPIFERMFMIKNRVVDWAGRRARLELSHDNSSVEYKLAKKDQERDAIIRTIPGGFARVDAQDMRTILWYGGGFLQLIGYTKEQFEDELDSKCTYVHPDDLEHTVEVMESAKDNSGDTIVETRVVTRDGEIKVLTMTFSYVSAEESWDGVASFYSVGIEVTKERREQERQRKALEDAYQAARVASSAKTNFLSSMSHDIRTPMNAIMGMAAIAQANLDSPEKMRDCLNKIGTSSRHLLSLINEVLDMSKIESGKIDLTLERVNLPELVQNVTDICRPLIADKQQQFQISINQVQHENVVADGDRLQQILMNLLSNAIKYTPEGGIITLRINELHAPSPGKSQYEFICMDNGIGIAREFIPIIFEPFTRAEDPRISKLQGTGLGMTITENIVRMMNGTIQVQSKQGIGSKFTVSIPLEFCSEEQACSSELAGLPVLVADDDQVTCETTAALLNELGMRGYWVLSGKEAVTRIAKAHEEKDDFFAVILDWKMPEMDGLETVKAIREKLGEHVPIIIISAYDYSEIEDEFLRAGADAFISKPLFKSKMLQVLQLFVSITEQRGSESAVEAEELSEALKKQILLVEDNDINREIAMEILQMQNYEVDAVENGKRALEAFEAAAPGTYNAILMDIQMPVMNGYEATAAIRALEREDAKKIPIIALTADAFTADVVKARSVGMNDHIAKPIDIEGLVETLGKWIG